MPSASQAPPSGRPVRFGEPPDLAATGGRAAGRIEIPGPEHRLPAVGMKHGPGIRRPGETVRHRQAIDHLPHAAIRRDPVERRVRPLVGRVVHAADPEGAVRPDLSVVQAVARPVRLWPRQILEAAGAGIEERNARPQGDDDPSICGQSAAADGLGHLPSLDATVAGWNRNSAGARISTKTSVPVSSSQTGDFADPKVEVEAPAKACTPLLHAHPRHARPRWRRWRSSNPAI